MGLLDCFLVQIGRELLYFINGKGDVKYLQIKEPTVVYYDMV